MIKNIIFDLGGVITNIDQYAALNAFSNLGISDIDLYLDPYQQQGIFMDLETGKLNAQQFRQACCTLSGREVSMEEIFNAWLTFASELQVEKLRCLNKLSKNYMLYLLSNTNPYIMLWADSFDFSEDNCPISFYFDKMYCSYKIGYTNPDQRFFDYMITDSGILPQETLFVDDGSANISLAKRLGFEVYQPRNGRNWCEHIYWLLDFLDKKYGEYYNIEQQ